MRSFAFGGTAGACWAALTVLCGVSGPAFAADVVLKDGTVIHGEIESLQDGVYTVRSDSLGTVRVRKQEVRSIDESGDAGNRSAAGSSVGASSAPGAGLSSPPGAELQGLELGLLQDPKLLQMLLSLQNDPDVLAVLSNPDVMKEIAAGDYAALMNDPKIIALMQNEKVRAIIDEVR